MANFQVNARVVLKGSKEPIMHVKSIQDMNVICLWPDGKKFPMPEQSFPNEMLEAFVESTAKPVSLKDFQVNERVVLKGSKEPIMHVKSIQGMDVICLWPDGKKFPMPEQSFPNEMLEAFVESTAKPVSLKPVLCASDRVIRYGGTIAGAALFFGLIGGTTGGLSVGILGLSLGIAFGANLSYLDYKLAQEKTT
jgi:hypothetical protein